MSATPTPTSPTKPIRIATSGDLSRALLAICESAANGKADKNQASILCQASNTLINLAKLQLAANNGSLASAPWLLKEGA
jgi:hypothetical protein